MIKYDMSADAYFAHSAVNRSQLSELDRSPLHYWAKYVNPGRVEEPETETPAFRIGRAIHARVLEPLRYADHFMVGPNVSSRNTTKWRAAEEAFKGEMLLTVKEDRIVEGVNKALVENPLSRRALFESEGSNEVSVFAKDPKTDIDLKCRVDRLMDNGMLVDVKSTADASPSAFAKSCANYGYALQAAHYLYTVEMATGQVPAGFGFVVVEKEPPHAVAVYRASEDFLRHGAVQHRNLLDRLGELHRAHPDATTPWPAYSVEVQSLDLPAWATR